MSKTRHGSRVRLAQGIYQDQYSIEVVARIGSGPTAQAQSRCYPLGTSIDWLMAERFRMLADLRDSPVGRRTSGTLAADLRAYLATLPPSPKTTDYGYLLAHWIAAPVGMLARSDITLHDLEVQLATWAAAGVPAVTRNHRIRALRAAWRAYREGLAPVLADQLTYARPPKPTPRGVPMPIIARILDSIPDHGQAERGQPRPPYSVTKIRLRVMAWTGLSHRSLVRLTRAMVNFAEGRLFMPERKKGQGAAGVWVSLVPPAIDALHAYDAAHLWGRPFSRSSMHKTWRKAIRRTGLALQTEAQRTGDPTALEAFTTAVPPDCRPYDLRHSFLTEVYRVTGDFRAVAAIAQHAELDTTKRYTEAGVAERVQAAIDQVSAAWAQTVPPAPPRLVRRRRLALVRRPDQA